MVSDGTYERLRNVECVRQTLQLDRICVMHDGHPLINNLSLTALQGEILVIVGENGTGKSCVLSTIAGMTHLHSGKATAFGVDIHKAARFQKHSLLAYSEQDVTLIENMSPVENIKFMCRFLG